MTQLQPPPSLDEVLRKYNNRAKMHTLRKLEIREDFNGATVFEIEVWRPVGTFQVVLEVGEVAAYGESGALDRYFQTLES